jgi:hypothetical protein
MFKVLILQTQNGLSDERTEFYLRDRLTWIRFLGLGLGDPVPDANTIWTFREALTQAVQSSGCSSSSTRSSVLPAISPYPGNWSDTTIIAAPSSAIAKRKNRRSRRAGYRKPGRPSRPSSGRRTAMRVGP